jgi:hypothetical protein
MFTVWENPTCEQLTGAMLCSTLCASTRCSEGREASWTCLRTFLKSWGTATFGGTLNLSAAVSNSMKCLRMLYRTLTQTRTPFSGSSCNHLMALCTLICTTGSTQCSARTSSCTAFSVRPSSGTQFWVWFCSRFSGQRKCWCS